MGSEPERSVRNGRLLPWEAHHGALGDAKAARGRFLRDVLFATGDSLRDGICR